jgi:hypothetical protein
MKYCLAEEATVYTDRSTTSPVVAALQAGDQIDMAEPTAAPGEGWDVVTLPDGKTGYSFGSNDRDSETYQAWMMGRTRGRWDMECFFSSLKQSGSALAPDNLAKFLRPSSYM